MIRCAVAYYGSVGRGFFGKEFALYQAANIEQGDPVVAAKCAAPELSVEGMTLDLDTPSYITHYLTPGGGVVVFNVTAFLTREQP